MYTFVYLFLCCNQIKAKNFSISLDPCETDRLNATPIMIEVYLRAYVDIEQSRGPIHHTLAYPGIEGSETTLPKEGDQLLQQVAAPRGDPAEF